jgi:hypothetical protein
MSDGVNSLVEVLFGKVIMRIIYILLACDISVGVSATLTNLAMRGISRFIGFDL